MEFEGLNNQIEKFNILQDEMDKVEQIRQRLRDRTKELEKEVYEQRYVNQISTLTEENLKLMLDVHLLSYQCDLLTFNNNNNNNRNAQNNPYGYGPSRFNNPYMNRMVPSRPLIAIPDMIAGPSFMINRNQVEPCLDIDNNILSRRLPHSNQIAATLQPCKLISSNTNTTTNNNNNQKSPPLPPRPNRQQHPSRSPPPPPPPSSSQYKSGGHDHHRHPMMMTNDSQQRKWKCARCTFENSESLNKCEVCEFARLVPPLDTIITNNLDSLHTLADSKHSPTSPSPPTHGHHGKKWNKRHNH
ncbi:hypothetical protein DERF_011419 [Dermatophagoides farinae]|uniref:RanBP2-type domain-containing protein n=2 Tax=Dermatophagoides farinae TaxID=6954 RepID=A0A922HSW4_DERFA|nr:hypothetical protein DERF_011419 [Dermatophagoides farinae]